MTPAFDWIWTALDVAGMIGGVICATAAVVWFVVRHTRVSLADFQAFVEDHGKLHDSIEKRLDRGSSEFEQIDRDFKHVPGQETIDALRHDLAELNGSVREILAAQHGRDERMRRIEELLDRILDAELKRGARA
jgi:hypothetical protein